MFILVSHLLIHKDEELQKPSLISKDDQEFPDAVYTIFAMMIIIRFYIKMSILCKAVQFIKLYKLVIFKMKMTLSLYQILKHWIGCSMPFLNNLSAILIDGFFYVFSSQLDTLFVIAVCVCVSMLCFLKGKKHFVQITEN